LIKSATYSKPIKMVYLYTYSWSGSRFQNLGRFKCSQSYFCNYLYL